MRRQEVIAGLKYIANSPPRENGGFHSTTVEIAKAALKIIKAQQTGKHEICVWRHDEDAWSTDCGQLFVLNEGRPYQNGMRFCYHCGRGLRAVR